MGCGIIEFSPRPGGPRRNQKDPTWYALLRGVWGADNLAPSFQPSASRACAYVACTFVYRKGGLRLAVVSVIRDYEESYLTYLWLPFLSGCSLPSPCN